MNGQSLYPNIDHKENMIVCKTLLGKRSNRKFPTNRLVKLIQLILKSNTMIINGPYFHQEKKTATGTPIALSYANIFMSVFEANVLLELQNKYKCKPAFCLRFTNDIFYLDRS